MTTQEVTQRKYMSGFWYGIHRVLAMNDDDAKAIYRKVVEENKLSEEDIQNPNAVSREQFDDKTKEFYADEGNVQYCNNMQSMYIEEKVETGHPQSDAEVNEKIDAHQAKIDSGEVEPTMPADIPARDQAKRAEYLEEATQKETETPSKKTPDADEAEQQEAKELNEMPVEEQGEVRTAKKERAKKQAKSSEEGVEEQVKDSGSLIEDIRNDTQSTVLGKYEKADFVQVANELGVPSEGTKQELYEIIKNNIN